LKGDELRGCHGAGMAEVGCPRRAGTAGRKAGGWQWSSGLELGKRQKRKTVDQISAILRDHFGILPKRRAIGYTKLYPSDYDLIPLPSKYRLPEFTKYSGAEGSCSIEHVS
jgi:hypothetical protein